MSHTSLRAEQKSSLRLRRGGFLDSHTAQGSGCSSNALSPNYATSGAPVSSGALIQASELHPHWDSTPGRDPVVTDLHPESRHPPFSSSTVWPWGSLVSYLQNKKVVPGAVSYRFKNPFWSPHHGPIRVRPDSTVYSPRRISNHCWN